MPARFLSDLAGTGRSQFRIKPAGFSGAPTTGYHQVGEIHMDSLATMWICTAAGTPGTWRAAAQFPQVSLALASGVNVLQAYSTVAVSAVDALVTLRKGTLLYQAELSALHDGATAALSEHSAVVGPGVGVLPVAFDADVNAGYLRILADAGETGWSCVFEVTALTLL